MKHASQNVSRRSGKQKIELSLFPLWIDFASLRALWAVFKSWRRGERLRIRQRFRFECRCANKWR